MVARVVDQHPHNRHDLSDVDIGGSAYPPSDIAWVARPVKYREPGVCLIFYRSAFFLASSAGRL